MQWKNAAILVGGGLVYSILVRANAVHSFREQARPVTNVLKGAFGFFDSWANRLSDFSIAGKEQSIAPLASNRDETVVSNWRPSYDPFNLGYKGRVS